jgi:putative phosphoribosyl transferase
MREVADDVVCLELHDNFGAIGLFYSDFRQTSDREVIEILARFSSLSAAKTEGAAA